MFTLFPIVLLFSWSFPALMIAFFIRGLKEFGDTSRKALHRQLQRTGTTRSNDWRLLLDPRLDRECRSNSRSLPLESKSRGQFSRRGRIWHCRNNHLPEGDAQGTPKAREKYQMVDISRLRFDWK